MSQEVIDILISALILGIPVLTFSLFIAAGVKIKKDNEARVQRSKLIKLEAVKAPAPAPAMKERQAVREVKLALIQEYSQPHDLRLGALGGRIFSTQYDFQTFFYDKLVAAMHKHPDVDIKVFKKSVFGVGCKAAADQWGASAVLDVQLLPVGRSRPWPQIFTAPGSRSFGEKLYAASEKLFPGIASLHHLKRHTDKHFGLVTKQCDSVFFLIGACEDPGDEHRVYENADIIAESIVKAALLEGPRNEI